MSKGTWIAVDWGTSNLRIWIMGAEGDVIERITSDQGMLGLTQEQFEPVLVSHIEPWLASDQTPVIACGMVGSRQGWVEAPYESVPTQPAMQIIDVQTQDSRLNVRVIAGLQQHEPADVMRGEETQVSGYLAQNPQFSGVICLPGTHSKWVVIGDGKVTSFQTVLTGELFDLLAHQSILRHSMGPWHEARFLQAVSEGFAAPQSLLTRLFAVRAAQLLQGDESGKSQLSGMIIGAELGALKPVWQGNDVVIIGAGELARLYGAALLQEGADVTVADGEDMTLSGLKHVFESVFL